MILQQPPPPTPGLDADILFIAIGASVALTVFFAVWRSMKINSRSKRILEATPAASVDAAAEGALVAIKGRARPADPSGAAMTATPIGKKAVLWWRLTIRGETHKPGMLMWNNLLVEIGARDFLLEDANKRTLRVTVTQGTPLVVTEHVDKTLCMDGQKLTDDVASFLTSRPDLAEAVGPGSVATIAVRTFEETIRPGDEIEVVGIKRGDTLVAGPDGLVVVHGDAKAHAKSGRLWARGPDA